MVQQTILRLPEVIARTGLSRSSIYAGMKSGVFPSHLALGERAVGWYSGDIDAWIGNRVAISTQRRK